MLRRKAILPVALAGACVVLAGCMPKMTIEQMKAAMPQRPAELDRLNAFVGKWQYEGQTTFAMLDEPLKTTGTGETKWDGSRWFIVSRSTFEMENFDPMVGVETWTYDVHSKKYRSTWTDSMGTVGLGEGWYDEKTNTWKMKATSHGAWGKSTAKGWIKFLDDDTMEWSWTECQGLMKTMEMTGTARRVK